MAEWERPVHKVLSFVRVDLLTAASYRVNMALSLAALVVMTIPIYFVSQAIQPVAADAIQGQGGEYFAFFLIGTAVYGMVVASMQAIPGAVGSGIRTGTLEALLSTPTRLASLLGGMIGYRILWSATRALVFIVTGWFLGAQYFGQQSLVALGIVLLIVLAHVPFGMMAAALILAFRTAGPLLSGVMVGSALLGGVYYPTHVIPSWIEHLSALFPLTYGLRALRQTFLEGMPLQAVAPDLVILAAFVVALTIIGMACLRVALAYARRSGTLAEY
jgi:ABC-2 type transport system permease protein